MSGGRSRNRPRAPSSSLHPQREGELSSIPHTEANSWNVLSTTYSIVLKHANVG